MSMEIAAEGAAPEDKRKRPPRLLPHKPRPGTPDSRQGRPTIRKRGAGQGKEQSRLDVRPFDLQRRVSDGANGALSRTPLFLLPHTPLKELFEKKSLENLQKTSKNIL